MDWMDSAMVRLVGHLGRADIAGEPHDVPHREYVMRLEVVDDAVAHGPGPTLTVEAVVRLDGPRFQSERDAERFERAARLERIDEGACAEGERVPDKPDTAPQQTENDETPSPNGRHGPGIASLGVSVAIAAGDGCFNPRNEPDAADL